MKRTPKQAFLAAIMLSFCVLTPAPALAQNEELPTVQSAEQTPLQLRAEQIVALLNGELSEPLEQVFTSAFLADVPPAQLTMLSAQLTAQFGRALGVESIEAREGNQAILQIRMEKAIAKGPVVLNAADTNKITGLRFTEFEPVQTSVAAIEADLAALPGTVTAYFAPLDGGDPVISIGADQPMALGSTIKLYVLAALGEDIAQGKRTWSDVVPLTAKSFPSGQMQDWPTGSPATLHTLASLMISISDNTATDQLIEVLGRDRVLKLMRDSGHSAPDRNDPLLTTLDLFELKASGPALIEAWRNGDRDARAAILEQLTEREISMERVEAAFSGGPNAIDIEWFSTPRDLARLFQHMRRNSSSAVFPIMAINPNMSPATKAKWNYAGYKGGSEPGVLNLTWLLEDKSGEWHILTLGWNNAQANVDETALELIAQSILSLPH